MQTRQNTRPPVLRALSITKTKRMRDNTWATKGALYSQPMVSMSILWIKQKKAEVKERAANKKSYHGILSLEAPCFSGKAIKTNGINIANKKKR